MRLSKVLILSAGKDELVLAGHGCENGRGQGCVTYEHDYEVHRENGCCCFSKGPWPRLIACRSSPGIGKEGPNWRHFTIITNS